MIYALRIWLFRQLAILAVRVHPAEHVLFITAGTTRKATEADLREVGDRLADMDLIE